MSIWRNWSECELGVHLRSLGTAPLDPRQVAAVIHIENVSLARTILEHNQKSGFTILDAEENESGSDGEEIKTTNDDPQATPRPSAPCGTYILLDAPPKHVYRKRKAKFTGSEYLFGRGDLADVCLAQKSSRAKVSSQHFVLRLHNDVWVIEHLAQFGTTVNNIVLQERGSMIALHPALRNTIKVPGDVNIHIYCNDPIALYFARELQHPMDELLMNGLDIRSSVGTSTQLTEPESFNTEEPFIQEIVGPMLYILWNHPIHCDSSRQAYRVLDPWTCQHQVVSVCKSEDANLVRRRFHATQAISVHRSINTYCALVKIDGDPMLLSPWHDVMPLRVYVEGLTSWHSTRLRAVLCTARSLLWTLLGAVGHINSCDVVHGDISLDTILVKELETDYSDILVSGFSECRYISDPDIRNHFTKDCLDVFKIVKSVLQSLQEQNDQMPNDLLTRQGWLGHPYLDALWQRLDRPEPWTVSTLDVCERINLPLDECAQSWRFFRVRRCFDITTQNGPEGLLLNLSDLIEYIQKDALESLTEEERAEVDSAITAHLKHKNYSDYASESAFSNFRKHVAKKIDRSVCTDLAHKLGKTRRLISSDCVLPVYVSFSIACNLPSRLFNLTQLLGFVHRRDLTRAQSLLSNSSDYYEVRGDRSLQGIYMPLRYLEQISEGVQLETVGLFEQISAFKGTPIDLAWYDYQHWILLADTAFSAPARLNRATRVVSWDGHDYELGNFLRTYMPLSALDVRPHSLEPTERIFDLPLPKSLATKSMTYDDSCQSIDDPLKFRWKSRDAAAKRTSEWISKTESTRTTRKKVAESYPEAPVSPSMKPTVFTFSGRRGERR